MVMNYIKRVFGSQEDLSVESVNIPFFRLVFSPFNYVLDNGKTFFLSASIYSVILAVLSYALGTLFLCSFETAREHISCSSSELSFYIFLFIKTVLVLLFAVFFYEFLSQKNFSLKNLFVFSFKNLKLLGLFVVVIVLCLVPVLSMYVLYVRVPNPDWVIELLFFAFVSLGFLVPFIVFRFLSIVGLVLEERKIPSFVAIWSRTGGNMFKIIFSISFILAFLLVLIMNFYYNFVTYDANSFVAVFIIEYAYNLISFLFVALFIGHIKAQTFYLFGDEK